jgi:two-component system, chemotaxis family, sensor kinase Cph1
LKKRNSIHEAGNLRKKAENLLKNKRLKIDAKAPDEDIRRLVHELQVHQIELEMQNEELVRAKEMIAEAAHEKYKELYDFAPTAYFTISKEGKIQEFNLKGADLLGMDRQSLINLKFSKFITRETNLIFEDFLRKVFSRKAVESCEVTLWAKPPVTSFVYLTGYVIEDGERCLLTVIDITQRKSAEDQLKNKMDELTKAYRQLEEYSFHNQELKQFAYISSHELQQPLRTIYNFIQIYEEEYSRVIDDKAHKYLEIIKDSAKRMYTLVNSLWEYSRLGMNKTRRLVNFKELINNVITDLDAAIKSSGAEILVSDMPAINVNEIEFHQVFVNLLSNAIKFHRTGVKPVVQVSSEINGDNWKFSVCDNGIGISPEHFDKLFTMFQRLHSDESEFEGKGIGLTICKKVIELHHGHIWVESNGQLGTTFYFTIPSLNL